MTLRRPVAAVLALTAAAAALLPACSSGEDDEAVDDPGPSTTDVDTSRCAWKVRADEETLNIAYPDTAATYWGLSYDLAPGESLELHGRFPDARYLSFVSYRLQGGAIDVLADRDIDPDPGGVNPFRPDAGGRTPGAGDAYTVEIRPDLGETDEPNVVGGRADASDETGSDASTSTTEMATSDRVLLGSGGPDAVGGTLLCRVYVPTDADDPTGGGGLPSVRLVDASGASTEILTCPEPGASQAARDIVDSIDRDFAEPPAEPIFIRPQPNQANIFPNPDNIYVATTVRYEPGRIAVIRGRAPTFPDTAAGDPITGEEQVRYWSMCTNEARKPYPVTDCAVDSEVALDEDGWYTFVISTPEDRPADTPATVSSTWLDWGATDVSGLLLLRHMLPDGDFPEAANNLAPGALAITTMGEYAPTGAYCTTAAFEEGGAAACGL